MYYINYFFIFSILGHLLEIILYNKSGILFGWWTPIYGIGSVIILLINYLLIEKLKLKRAIKVIVLFLACAIILSTIEFIGGNLIEYFFHTSFWDYTKYKYNFGKYAALEMSLIWGLSSILLIYFLKPLMDKIIGKIPKYLTYLLIILFIIDLVITIFIKH